MNTGRKDREARILEERVGNWASSSQDYLFLATELYELSFNYANKCDGNVSPYVLSGIPLLISTLRALLIEVNAGMYGVDRNERNLRHLAREPNEISLLTNTYLRGDETLVRLVPILFELRNEIVHPAHTPVGTADNTPVGMNSLRQLGLLDIADAGNYCWIDQIKSHRLFHWSFEIVEKIAIRVFAYHGLNGNFSKAQLDCYSRFHAHGFKNLLDVI